jgi:hypothetical protein
MPADEIIFCATCDTSHGRYDCPADPFGAPETITVADLRAGDFVISIPEQRRVRGYRIGSGVAEISEPAHFGWQFGPARRKVSVKSRKVRFHDRELGRLDLPVMHEILVRRLAKVAS